MEKKSGNENQELAGVSTENLAADEASDGVAGLLPCPWCQGPAEMTSVIGGDEGDGYVWHVHCSEDNDCTMMPDLYSYAEDEAVRRWNTRVNPRDAVLASIVAERQRQIEAEGYTPEHDDKHDMGELALAAALYAIPYDANVNGERFIKQDDFIGLQIALETGCDFYVKPEPDNLRRLVKAGALILAEIDRIQRTNTAVSAGAT